MALTKIDDRGLKTPIDLLDNEKIRFGTGNDLHIWHDGDHTRFRDTGTGYIIFESDTGVLIRNEASDEWVAKFLPNSAVELYYDDSKKFETTSTGITTTGTVTFNNSSGTLKAKITSDGNYKNEDSVKFIAGTDNDLQIYHDGSNSRIVNSGTGDLTLQANKVWIGNAGLTEVYIEAQNNSQVELKYDNVKKFETTSTGILVSGDLIRSSNDGSTANDLQLASGSTWGFRSKPTSGTNSYGLDIYKGTGGTDVKLSIDTNGVLWHGSARNASHFTNRSAYFHKSGSGDWNYISITGGTSGGAGIVFGDTVENNTGNYEGIIGFDNGNNSLYLKTAQSTKGLELKVGGDVHVIDGNLSLASGHGIDFSATSDATGKTSELLDDYEEGTFTPTIHLGISAQSYYDQYGHYIKIGNKVHLDFYIRVDNANANGNQYAIGNFPFNLKSANHIRGGGCSTYWNLEVNSSYGSNDNVVSLYGEYGNNFAQLWQGDVTARGTSGTSLNGKYFIGFFEYICA